MRTSDMIAALKSIMDKAGFVSSEALRTEPAAFDIVSRRDDQLLIFKTMASKNAINGAMANDIKVLAKVLRGSPLLLIQDGPGSGYQEGVLYIRFGIPLMTLKTLYDHLIEEVPPMVYRGAGGHFVSLNGSLFRSKREELKLSLGALAETVGVSRKAIQMYEGGMGADVEIALKVESVLGVALIQPLDPFYYDENLQEVRDNIEVLKGLKKEVFDHLDSIGMEVIPTAGCPFHALTKGGKALFLTSVEKRDPSLKKRASRLSDISRVTGKGSVMIVDNAMNRNNIGGTPILRMSELREADDVENLVRLIRERL